VRSTLSVLCPGSVWGSELALGSALELGSEVELGSESVSETESGLASELVVGAAVFSRPPEMLQG